MTILDELADHARYRVSQDQKKIPAAEMRKLAEAIAAEELKKEASGFSFPFEKALAAEGMSFICEVKKASPSKGIIAEDFPYREIARSYEEAGAAAISCLTEPKWFMGKDQYLYEIAHTVRIPVLRKDFTVDPYMIYQAKALGASAILLIAALLPEDVLRDYHQIADSLGLSALVEAHDEREIDAAVRAGARIIGVNNRNLKDFSVDINNAARLKDRIPEGVIYVSESGIRDASDVGSLYRKGIGAVLIGEALMRSEDKKAMLEDLRSECC